MQGMMMMIRLPMVLNPLQELASVGRSGPMMPTDGCGPQVVWLISPSTVGLVAGVLQVRAERRRRCRPLGAAAVEWVNLRLESDHA
jgi:hypothetical protein